MTNTSTQNAQSHPRGWKTKPAGSTRRWSHVTPGEEGNKNRLSLLISISVRDILRSPVRCGACALEREAEWALDRSQSAALCPLHPSAVDWHGAWGGISDEPLWRRMGKEVCCWWRYGFLRFPAGKARFGVWHCDRGGWRMLGCMGGNERWGTRRG